MKPFRVSLRKRVVLAAGICSLLFATLASAHLQSGRLYGTITDTDGNPLPDVQVTLEGMGNKLCKATDEHGQIRFLGLDPGVYQVVAERDGFSRVVYEQVAIRIGRNTTLQLQMSEVLEETITVTTEPPLLEAGLRTEITISEFELDEIPTSRDPWAIVSQTPGVLVDRINVGGSESGQQPLFVGRGSSSRENAYIVDGVNITDMAAVGATPAYYDFDQLGEMQVTTGGADAAIVNAGVTLNLVTKRGTNRWLGSGRFFVIDDSWQSNPSVNSDDFAPGQHHAATNRVRGMDEVGAELGGPLRRQRLWVWGAYSHNDIDRLALGGLPDDIDLENTALKLNAQGGSSTSGVLSVNSSRKDRFGRGASLSRGPETLWDQRGGADLFTLEASHLFGRKAFASLLLSRLDSDFYFDPRGGPDREILQDADGVWRGSYVQFANSRDADQFRASASRFFSAFRADHELELELSGRQFQIDQWERWGPRNLIHYAKENSGGQSVFEALRPGPLAVRQDYTSLWLQDTIARRNTTLRIGLRYDEQKAANLPGSAPAHPLFPDLLPAMEFDALDAGFVWRELSPRVGLTYSIGERANTMFRLSYAHFPSQLYSSLAARVGFSFFSGGLFEFDDLDGDQIFDTDEPHALIHTFGVDADDPLSALSPNRNDRGLRPETTDEIVFGLDHSPRRDLVLGVDVIYRSMASILEARRLVRSESGVRVAERNDFVLDGVVEGDLPRDAGRFEVPVYTLRDGLEYTGGSVLTNGDRSQDYLGASFTISKRMTNRWMLRGHLTLSDWEWELGSEFLRFDDPTDLAISFGPDSLVSNSDTQGDVVAEPSREREDGLFLNSRWQFNVAALYNVAPLRKWGFNIAANLHGREGFPGPYRVNVIPADGLPRQVQVTEHADDFRYDDVLLADLRIEKELRFSGFGTILSIDVFNVFNAGSVLERSLQLNGPQPDYLLQTLSPRVVRVGLRLQWD